MRITFFEEGDTRPERAWADTVTRVLGALAQDCGVDFCLNIQLTDNEGIRALNREFRNIDDSTDVLSFPNYELNGLLPDCMNSIEPEMEAEGLFVGDIAISVERAEEQAAEYGHGMVREMAFLALHGALHLLGYDHMDEDGERKMMNKQREILGSAGVGRD